MEYSKEEKGAERVTNSNYDEGGGGKIPYFSAWRTREDEEEEGPTKTRMESKERSKEMEWEISQSGGASTLKVRMMED